MDFYKSKVYTALNADDISRTKSYYFANTIAELRTKVMSESNNYTNLAFVCEDRFEKRFHTINNEEYSFAYEVPYFTAEGDQKFMTSDQIDKMAELFYYDEEVEIKNGKYIFIVDFSNKNHTMYSYDREPTIEVYCDSWEGPLYGKFIINNHASDKYYLRYLSTGPSYKDVEIPDKILKDVNDKFFEVFNDEYIENLIYEHASEEEKKKKDATENFFNKKVVVGPKPEEPSLLDKLKDRVVSFIDKYIME